MFALDRKSQEPVCAGCVSKLADASWRSHSLLLSSLINSQDCRDGSVDEQLNSDHSLPGSKCYTMAIAWLETGASITGQGGFEPGQCHLASSGGFRRAGQKQASVVHGDHLRIVPISYLRASFRGPLLCLLDMGDATVDCLSIALGYTSMQVLRNACLH